jgi:hypothetical protein
MNIYAMKILKYLLPAFATMALMAARNRARQFRTWWIS